VHKLYAYTHLMCFWRVDSPSLSLSSSNLNFALRADTDDEICGMTARRAAISMDGWKMRTYVLNHHIQSVCSAYTCLCLHTRACVGIFAMLRHHTSTKERVYRNRGRRNRRARFTHTCDSSMLRLSDPWYFDPSPHSPLDTSVAYCISQSEWLAAGLPDASHYTVHICVCIVGCRQHNASGVTSIFAPPHAATLDPVSTPLSPGQLRFKQQHTCRA
jgi:hypothetical protein